MEQFRIPYGIAVTLRIGSLRDADPDEAGAFVVPTFASGDVTTEQDDGTGFENADDATPGLDGSVIELDVSEAEASVPAALGGKRIYRFVDQTDPAVWVPREIQIVTTDHHLAAEPNGVIRKFEPVAIDSDSVQLDAGADVEIDPTGMFAVIVESDDPLDIGAAGVISGWNSGTEVAELEDGWTKAPNGTVSSIRVALYANQKAIAGLSLQGQEDLQSVLAANKLAQLGQLAREGACGNGSHTTSLIANSNITGLGNDRLNGRPLTFVSGTLAGLTVKILDYTSATGAFSVETILGAAMPAAPADGDDFIVH